MGRSGGGLTSRKREAVAHPTWKIGERASERTTETTPSTGVSCIPTVKKPDSLGLQVSNKLQTI